MSCRCIGGHIKELPFITGEGPSKKVLYRQLADQYQEYAVLNKEEDKEEEMTSSLLTADQLLKYYDGETFDWFFFERALEGRIEQVCIPFQLFPLD